jgi:erythronate-4-phosphate dehydrogenase
MKIVCADGIPYAREAFAALGEVRVLPGRAITAADVRDADALMIRSTTKVGPALLEGSRVRFVATATIGTDHLDIPYLERRGIAWCGSPGCNANSVSEYIAAALLVLGRRHGLELAGRTLGVVGVGRVGTRVVAKARALGLRVILNDPPRFDAEGDAVFRPLEELLVQSDILTLHVPLEPGGPYPTVRLAGERFFSRLKPGAILINAARGPVVDTDALLAALRGGRVSHAVLDTWDPEPAFRPDALAAVDLGTPHIAGYSFDGKVNGTVMIYRELCRFLGKKPEWTPEALLPPPAVTEVRVQVVGRSDQEVLAEVVRAVYDIEADDRALREGLPPDEAGRAAHFDRLRRDYPERREWPFTRVLAEGASKKLRGSLAGLGFVVP